MEPIAPGVGTGIILEIPCIIVSTRNQFIQKRILVQEGLHSSLWNDVFVKQILVSISKRPLAYK